MLIPTLGLLGATVRMVGLAASRDSEIVAEGGIDVRAVSFVSANRLRYEETLLPSTRSVNHSGKLAGAEEEIGRNWLSRV